MSVQIASCSLTLLQKTRIFKKPSRTLPVPKTFISSCISLLAVVRHVPMQVGKGLSPSWEGLKVDCHAWDRSADWLGTLIRQTKQPEDRQSVLGSQLLRLHLHCGECLEHHATFRHVRHVPPPPVHPLQKLSVARYAQVELAFAALATEARGDPQRRAQLLKILISVIFRLTQFLTSMTPGVAKPVVSIHLALDPCSPILLSEAIAISSLLETIFPVRVGPVSCGMEWCAVLVAVAPAIQMSSVKGPVGPAVQEFALLGLRQQLNVESWLRARLRHAVAVVIKESGISKNGHQ